MKEVIHIVCCVDNQYIQHCAAMLASVFYNVGQESFKIHILTNDLSKRNREKIRQYIEKKQYTCAIYEVDETLLKNAPVSLHISLAAYYRIFIEQILSQSIQKVLYLDCDLLVRDNIANLWNTNIDDFFIAAAQDFVPAKVKANVGLSNTDPYFNTGVLLVNLKKWRDYNVMQKALLFINDHPDKITYWDQDVLNNLLKDKWKELSHYWNMMTGFYGEGFKLDRLCLDNISGDEALLNPGIVHFTGTHKPWSPYLEHPLKQEYNRYLDMTPWKTPKVNLYKFVRKKASFVKKLLKAKR